MARIYNPGETVYVIDIEGKVLERIGEHYYIEFPAVGKNGKATTSIYPAKYVHHTRLIDRIIQIEEKLELE